MNDSTLKNFVAELEPQSGKLRDLVVDSRGLLAILKGDRIEIQIRVAVASKLHTLAFNGFQQEIIAKFTKHSPSVK